MKKQIQRKHLIATASLAISCIVLIGLFSVIVANQMIVNRTSVSVETNDPQKLSEFTPAIPPNTPETLPPIDEVDTSAVRDLTDEDLEKIQAPRDAEEESIYYTLATANDFYYDDQWHLDRIDAQAAWDITTGTSDIVVAVVDTGFALDHEDLTDVWLLNDGEMGMTSITDSCWTGTPEDKRYNACDDDNNGFDDDWRGFDFANNDSNAQAGDNSDAGAVHGTIVSSLVAGSTNNSIGTSSINWRSKILPLQALADEGSGSSIGIAGAIIYAADRGADVINLSLGSETPSIYILGAIQYANSKGAVVVAAAGNCGVDCMNYPALFEEVIAVGASDINDTRASFSSTGPELDIVAPGLGRLPVATWDESNETSAYELGFIGGTSYASPIVAGAVGLLLEQEPLLGTNEVRALLRNGSEKVPNMGGADRTNEYGHGRLNVLNSLNEITELEKQRNKASGALNLTDPTIPPKIYTNQGHTNASGVVLSSRVTTLCVTTPGALCTITISDGVNNYEAGSEPANTQGIAVVRWDGYVVPAAGTYQAYASSNGLTSAPETLIVIE